MKVSSKIYKGIEYIQLNELPSDQKEKISEFLDSESLIKILINEKVVCNCIQYKEYEKWFDTVFRKAAPVPVKKERLTEVPAVSIA